MLSTVAAGAAPTTLDSVGTPLLWAATLGLVVTLLALDFVLTRRPHEVAMREALAWSAFYVALPLLFGFVQDDAAILRFVNSADAPRLAELGTSCPDHFLRTKIKPLYVAWDPATDRYPECEVTVLVLSERSAARPPSVHGFERARVGNDDLDFR